MGRSAGRGTRIVIIARLSDEPFRFYEAATGPIARSLGHAVAGGARITPYFKDLSTPAVSIGAQLLPGACELLLGVPAHEVAGMHAPLGALWGRAAGEWRERLIEAAPARRRLDVLEEALAARLPRARGLHPAVAHALERFGTGARVGDVVRETGYSHRRFIDVFRQSVGLGPKPFCRVRRFQGAFARLADPCASAVQVALEAGYSDQAHLVRDFRELGGITPGAYRRSTPARPGHVPIRPSGV